MSLIDTLISAGDGSVVKQLTGQFGLTGDQVSSAISTIVPALAGGLKEKLASGGNAAESLTGLISGGSLTNFLDNPAGLGSPSATETGNNLLGQIFGGGSLGNLTSMIGEKTGIGSDVISKLLPIVMTLVGGFLSKNSAPGSGTDLTGLLGTLSGDSAGLLGAVKGLAAKIFS